MMYNQRQPNFVQPRQAVPQNIRPQQPQTMNNMMATSPATNMYQQGLQTTMFMAPNQTQPFLRGQAQVITMSGGPQQNQFGQYPIAQQYTINTSQPTTYTVQPSYFPLQTSNQAVYYQAPPNTNIASPAMQQTPQNNPTPQQPVAPAQPSRPVSQPNSVYHKRERKGIAIIDPATGKDISYDLREGKTSTPPQTGSGSGGTPVGNTPPPQTQPVLPQQQGSGAIAAQFAAQVAATLNTKGQQQQVKQGGNLPTPQTQTATAVGLPGAAHGQPPPVQVPPPHGSQSSVATYQPPPPPVDMQQPPPPQQQMGPHVIHAVTGQPQGQQTVNIDVPPVQPVAPVQMKTQEPIPNVSCVPTNHPSPQVPLQQTIPTQQENSQLGVAIPKEDVPVQNVPAHSMTVKQTVPLQQVVSPQETQQQNLPPTQHTVPPPNVPQQQLHKNQTVPQATPQPVFQTQLPVSPQINVSQQPQIDQSMKSSVPQQTPPQQVVHLSPQIQSEQLQQVVPPGTEGKFADTVTVSVSAAEREKAVAGAVPHRGVPVGKEPVVTEKTVEKTEVNPTVEPASSKVLEESTSPDPCTDISESVKETVLEKNKISAEQPDRNTPPVTQDVEYKEVESSVSVSKNALAEVVPEKIQSLDDSDKKKNPPRQRLKEPEDSSPPAKEITLPVQKPSPPTVKTETPVRASEESQTRKPEPPKVVVQTPSVVSPSQDAKVFEESSAVMDGEDNVEQTVKDDNKNEDTVTPEEEKEETVTAESKKKKELKYDYKADQWSPINIEGKKSYDRAFLLKLQYTTSSTTKPPNLPHLPELVLETPQRPGNEPQYRGSQVMMDFTPGYIRPMNQRGTPMPKNRSRETRGRGDRKVISINREPEVQLQKTENPYKPAYKQEKDPSSEESKIEELYRKIRSILNKLTPQKFQTLMQQILDLKIDNEEKLTGAIDIIFEKAIDEPAFSVAYANACKIMAQQVRVASTANPSELVTFKKLLLNRCQTEFEKDKTEALDFEKMEKAIEEAESEEKKKELREEKEIAESKAKRRSLGNIRFIGELFKLNMLTERIMHDCIMNLLKSNDEENLECLCRLVTTIGKGLDHEKAKQLMDQYFTRIDKIIKTKGVSSRTRFMLQDLVDLRQNKWKPRRDDNAPKTIEQIHKDAEDEKVQKEAMAQRLAMEQRRTGGSGNRGRGMQQSTDEQGWQSVGPVRTNRIDPSKMKISKTNVDDNIQLGPGGGGPKFGHWGRGSTGGGRNASQESEKPSPANRFSLLSGQGPVNSETEQRRSSVGRSGIPTGRDSRGGRLTPSGGRSLARSSQEKDRENAIKAVKNISAGRGSDRVGRLTPSGSRNQSRDNSRNREFQEPEKIPSPVPLVPKEMDDHTIERKTKSIIDEYLSIHDLKEAMECAKEIPPHLMHKFADFSIQHVLERSDVARRMTGTLLHDLVKTSVLSVSQYLQGLKETLEFAEDMEIDIPKIWQYLGELIGPMVQDGSVPLSFLKTACEPLLAGSKAGLLVVEVLNDAVKRLGHVKVGNQWKSSRLRWADFVTGNVDEFVKKHKLEYTLDEEPRSPVGMGLSDEKIQVELDRLIKEKKVENEHVFDWVDTNVGEINIKKAAFIRALMTSVCSSAIAGSMEKCHVNIDILKKRGTLLQRYLDHDAELELQALYALQALVHKLQHPPDVLRIFFDTLYDEDIISEDAFNQWDTSKDPAEQAGKGVARSSVVQFFRWLREAEEEEQES